MKAEKYCARRDFNLPIRQALIMLRLEIVVGRYLHAFLSLNILSYLEITYFIPLTTPFQIIYQLLL